MTSVERSSMVETSQSDTNANSLRPFINIGTDAPTNLSETITDLDETRNPVKIDDLINNPRVRGNTSEVKRPLPLEAEATHRAEGVFLGEVKQTEVKDGESVFKVVAFQIKMGNEVVMLTLDPKRKVPENLNPGDKLQFSYTGGYELTGGMKEYTTTLVQKK